MNHKYSASLDNVRLRPLKKEDIEKLRIWRNDPDISRFLSPIPYITEIMQSRLLITGRKKTPGKFFRKPSITG